MLRLRLTRTRWIGAPWLCARWLCTRWVCTRRVCGCSDLRAYRREIVIDFIIVILSIVVKTEWITCTSLGQLIKRGIIKEVEIKIIIVVLVFVLICEEFTDGLLLWHHLLLGLHGRPRLRQGIRRLTRIELL